jgi:hypothetical protein
VVLLLSNTEHLLPQDFREELSSGERKAATFGAPGKRIKVAAALRPNGGNHALRISSL